VQLPERDQQFGQGSTNAKQQICVNYSGKDCCMRRDVLRGSYDSGVRQKKGQPSFLPIATECFTTGRGAGGMPGFGRTPTGDETHAAIAQADVHSARVRRGGPITHLDWLLCGFEMRSSHPEHAHTRSVLAKLIERIL